MWNNKLQIYVKFKWKLQISRDLQPLVARCKSREKRKKDEKSFGPPSWRNFL